MTYRLTMFAGPSVVDEDGETPPGLGPGKPLGVLCYLAVEGEVRRETVAALLWGETSESKARNAFRQALHRLRSALGEDMVPHDPDTVRVAGGADLWVDVREFERALSEGRPEDAVELVGGDFLEGFEVNEPGFDHWADRERARLRGRFLGALRDAATGALAEGRIEEAVRHARRLAEEDPLDSSSAVLEARTLTAAGRAEEARRLLADHAERYREQLGEDPPEEVADALTGLRGDGPEGAVGVADARAAGEPTLRPDALQRLLGSWREAVEGESVVVLLEGDAGRGKTWLVDELVRRVRPMDRPMVLRGAERMGRHGLPYAPVAEALRGVLRARGLAGASTHLLGEAARLLPELRDRFDLPIPPPIDDQAGQLRFYEGVASVLDAVAYEQPVLMALEGLEEADPPTLELIHFLVSRLGDSAILFLLSYRPTAGAGRAIADRFGQRAETVSLGRLDPRRLEALLEARVPKLGPMARAEAAAAADGSPGRALELAQRRLRGDPIAGPPAPLADILRSRLAGRSSRDRRILLVLALVGRPLTVRLVAAATHLPEGAVLESIPSLRAAGLVREREHGIELPDGPVEELVLESAGPAGRGLLAGWTLEALVAERAATDAELAHLAHQAGRPDEAARYGEAAGTTAARVGAYDLAREHLRRALEWTPDPAVRARLERLLAGLGSGGLRLGAGQGRGAGDGEPTWGSGGAWRTGGTGGPGGAGSPGSPTSPTSGAGGGRWGPGSRSRLGILVGALGTILVLVMLGVVELPEFIRGGRASATDRIVRDTLVLVRTDPDGSRTRLAFTGDPATALDRRLGVLGDRTRPRWVDSLRAAGLPALPSPEGDRVVIEEPAPGTGGFRLLAVTTDRRDTTALDAGDVRFDPLAWGPEGQRLLYRRMSGGRSSLRAASLAGGEPWAIGAAGAAGGAAADDVLEAAWSPDGTRVAWIARPRDAGEGEGGAVFVAFSDGTEPRRLTDYETSDYHLVWAPGGERVAFTSDRTGDAEIYAVEVRSGRLWRLTWNDAHDDRPAFSPDGEYLAFESTRGGEAAVYVVSSWGGQPQRVTGPGQRVEHAGWRGYPPPHLSHLRFRVPDPLEPGERGHLAVEPVFADYVARNSGAIRWRALDPGIVELAEDGPRDPVPSAAVADTFVVGRSAGLGRVAVSAGGWREDTVFVKVGQGRVRLSDAAAREGFPLSYGIRVEGRLVPGRDGGRDGGPGAGSGSPLRVSLVAPGVGVAGDGEGTRVASLAWRPGEERVTFQVEREEHSEVVEAGTEGAGQAPGLDFALLVGDDGRVAFAVRDTVRWRSTLRLTGTGLPLHRVRLGVEGGEGEGEVVQGLEVVVGGEDAE